MIPFKEYLDEKSSFVKVMNYLTGIKPVGRGLGIFTTDNPMGQKASSELNNTNLKEVKSLLKDIGKTYFQQKGKYGNYENSIVVIDVTEEDMKKLAFDERWKQDSFIHAKPSKEGLVYKMIRHNGKVATTKAVSADTGVQNLEDFFSEIKGRKYVLGFLFPDDFWE